MTMIGKNGKKMSTKSKEISLLLLDSSADFSAVQTFIENNPLTHIISFDFKSHEFLKNKNIKHDISDIFLDYDERKKLQDAIFKFSKWYDISELKKFVEYDKVNLGKLYYIELYVFLIPFLKIFFEIKHILSQFNSQIFATSFLYDILLTFNHKISLFPTKSSKSEFLYDSINIQTNFLKIKLPKSFLAKSKKISEIFLTKFSGLRKTSESNPILLTEFNTILYKNLFLEIGKNQTSSVYFGIRRPAIWNKKSYNIIKKSGCHIATESDVFTTNIEKSIQNDILKMKSKWKLLFESDTLFNSFFSYDGKSFWPALKPYFIKLYESRLEDSIKTINFANEYLKKTHSSCVLVLSESGTSEQILISLAKNHEIPIILIQHGLGAFDSEESDLINSFTGSMPIQSDKFFVWGEAMKRYALNFGIPNEKIFLVGSSAHDNLFDNSLNSINQDYILFSPESPSNNHINDYTVNVNKEYENILKTVCTVVSKLNKKLIIKLHPYINELNETKIAKSVNPEIQVIKKGDMSSLVHSCSLLITSGITSAMIDAAHLKKPIIRIKTREWWGEIDSLRTDSSIPLSIDELENTIKQLFSDSDFYQQIIQNGQNFVNDCISSPGTSSKKISDLLGNPNLK